MIEIPYINRILVVGVSTPYGKAVSYIRAFRGLGCKVEAVGVEDYYSVSFLNRALNRMLNLAGKTPMFWGVGKLNRALLEKIDEYKPEIVFFIKPIFITPSTINKIKAQNIKLFLWSADDMFNSATASTYFYNSIPLYNCHFTPKTFNISELLAKGARKAVLLSPAVDIKAQHYPVKVFEKDKRELGADVVFVGTYAPGEKRGAYLERLCGEGCNIKIYGNDWQKCAKKSCLRRKKIIQFRAVYGEEFSRVLNASKITLVFLRECNRDLIASKAYEVPACGVFMLHERSGEVAELYNEGVEAEFFGSFEELKQKIDYYLAHSEEREKIAKAGYKKATSHQFSYVTRAEKVLKIYHEIK